MLDPMLRRAACVATAALLVSSLATAQKLELAAVFGDHMVLQRGRPIPIWGHGRPGDPIALKFGDAELQGVVDAEGGWRMELPPQEAGGPFELVVAATDEVTVHDVLVGEVWVCSGQSNMEFPLKRANDADAEVAAADHPQIRLLHVQHNSSDLPVQLIEGSWQPCSAATVPDFSAVGYFFGRELQHDLDVPIGLIESSWGGTPAESWTRAEALRAEPAFEPIVARWDRGMKQWQEASAKVKEGDKKPRGPNPGWRPSGLFNGMIAPLIPFPIRGVIWYQGESNADRAYQYRALFPAMIEDWRDAWGQGDFPFLFVQLANFEVKRPATWAELREAQLMALRLPNTGMAVTIDIGNPKDIHPRDKQDVGKRLALWALADTYGKDVVSSGPLVRSVVLERGAVRVRFSDCGSGLAARGGGALSGFEVAPETGPFAEAQARIEGDSVVVFSAAVPNPVWVRYGWSDDPDCNLINKEGLPASPFRTDHRPEITKDAK